MYFFLVRLQSTSLISITFIILRVFNLSSEFGENACTLVFEHSNKSCFVCLPPSLFFFYFDFFSFVVSSSLYFCWCQTNFSMDVLTPENSFAALRELVVACSKAGSNPSQKGPKFGALSAEFALVDERVLTDNFLNRHLLDESGVRICIPEVVIDLLDKLDKTLHDEDKRNSILIIQEKYMDFYFQNVLQYDLKFIQKHNVQGDTADHLLILAAAKYFQEHLEEINAKKVVVLSDSKEIKEFQKKYPREFEIYSDVMDYMSARKKIQ